MSDFFCVIRTPNPSYVSSDCWKRCQTKNRNERCIIHEYQRCYDEVVPTLQIKIVDLLGEIRELRGSLGSVKK